MASTELVLDSVRLRSLGATPALAPAQAGGTFDDTMGVIVLAATAAIMACTVASVGPTRRSSNIQYHATTSWYALYI